VCWPLAEQPVEVEAPVPNQLVGQHPVRDRVLRADLPNVRVVQDEAGERERRGHARRVVMDDPALTRSVHDEEEIPRADRLPGRHVNLASRPGARGRNSFSIFIASSTTRPAPRSTRWPTSTSTATTLPGIGARSRWPAAADPPGRGPGPPPRAIRDVDLEDLAVHHHAGVSPLASHVHGIRDAVQQEGARAGARGAARRPRRIPVDEHAEPARRQLLDLHDEG
jgi:hypothetical protein